MVINLKKKIELVKGITCDQQRVIYDSKQLDDQKSMNDYKIKKGSKLYLVVKLRGGDNSFPFVNIENDDNYKESLFSNSAPDWRICKKGLNLEGVCKCNGIKKQVIIPIGYGTFDFTFDLIQSVCPICNQFVKPISCGFTDCIWKFNGIKVSKNGAPLYCCSEYKKVGNLYGYFKSNENNISDWTQLQITCSETIIGNCFYCQKDVNFDDQVTYENDIIYHLKCSEETSRIK